MPDLDRMVAGLRCRQVLAMLGNYVDGALTTESVEQVESHLRACDHCEKFGGDYSALVSRLRSRLTRTPLPPEGHARLAARLRDLWESEEDA